MRSVSVPLYILNDAEIARLIEASMEIMTELAGESDTSELPPLIEALRGEAERRATKVVSADDLDVPD